MTFEQFAFVVSIAMTLYGLGFLLTLIRFKKRSLEVKLIGVVFLLAIISNRFSGVLYGLEISPNYSASIYNIILLPLLSFLYFAATNRRHGKLLLGINVVYVSGGVLNLIIGQKASINSYTNILLSIIVIIYTVYYFFYLIRSLPTHYIQRFPMFWINSALIIFYAGNLVLFVFTSYLVEVLNNELLVYWTFHNCLSIVEAIMLVVAIVIDLRNTFRSGSANGV